MHCISFIELRMSLIDAKYVINLDLSESLNSGFFPVQYLRMLFMSLTSLSVSFATSCAKSAAVTPLLTGAGFGAAGFDGTIAVEEAGDATAVLV